MALHPNVDWQMPTGTISWQQAELAVLMDIRRELRNINAILRCHDTQRIPYYLRRIAAQTNRLPTLRRRVIKRVA